MSFPDTPSLPQLFDYRDRHFESRLWDGARAGDWDVHSYFRDASLCPCCGDHVGRWIQRLDSEDYSTLGWLKLCATCGWFWLWRSYQYRNDRLYDSERYIEWEYAILERFSFNDAAAPLTVLAKALKRDWRLTKHLSAQRAEDLVTGIFREHLAAEVEYVSDGVFAPDGGIDFVLATQPNGDRIAFQVKRRQTDAPERVSQFGSSSGRLRWQDSRRVSTCRPLRGLPRLRFAN